MAMHMEAEVPGIGAVGCYAEKQSPLCGKRKRQQKRLEEEDRQPRSVTPGALRVLPQDRFFSARSPQHSGCTSLDELHSKYPNHMDDLCENCYEVWFEKLRNSLIECGMMKRVTVEPLGTKQRQQVDPSPRLDPPGTSVWEVLRQVLPQDEEKERAFVRGFISFFLSKVSKETDARYMDSVNACDPSKVAAQLEFVLFENWGFNEQSRNRL